METAIYKSAKSTYGVLKAAQKDWVHEYADNVLPLYEMKEKAILANKKNPSNGIERLSLNSQHHFAKRRKDVCK